jgi:hypothetical protein
MGTVIGSFIGGLLAIGLAVFIYKKLSNKSVSETPSSESTRQETAAEPSDTVDEMQEMMQVLVRTNISLRTAYGLSIQVIELVETIIDLLNDAIPQMLDRYPSESLTYELKRICKEHLPRVVKEFMDLSGESRERHEDSFITSLGDIRDQVRRANEIIENNEVAEFKVMASFLKTKYSAGDI